MTIVVAGSTMTVSPELHPPTYHYSVPVETVLQVNIDDIYDINDVHRDIAEANSDLSPEPKYEEPNTDTALCNCYKFVDSVVDLPHSSVVRDNIGDSGNVAVFYYPESGLYHYAFVINRDGDSVMIAETNYRHCKYTQRVISIEYQNLLGFFQA